jgi:arginyl-tRNA synthetase
MIQDILKQAIAEALMEIFTEAGIVPTGGSVEKSQPLKVTLEHPAEISHGDYSTNVALAYSKELKMQPRIIAEKLVAHLADHFGIGPNPKKGFEDITAIEIAGPGFINIKLTPNFFRNQIMHIIKEGEDFGRNRRLKGQKIVIEYTNPNPFKVFHIGHLMTNAIGEALCRVFESNGANVVRVNYQGDVGLHVAKAVWGMLQDEANFPKDAASLEDMIAYISRSYVVGANAESQEDKEAIALINKMIFDRSNPKLMKIYNWGRKVSLLNFEVIYKKLGTKFDHYFFESEVAKDGLAIVRDFEKRGVFTESEGAVVFKGEPYGLHTRVFITSAGLPTYETKEVGLTRIKFDKFNPDMSIVVTANEQNDYFRVTSKALTVMFPYMAGKMKHISHGMLRLATEDGGSMKMGSRKGNAVTGESLLADVAEIAQEKMTGRDFGEGKSGVLAKAQAVNDVTVGAIKYSILKQATGSDIIYDFGKSVSFEGDSGPYLQYACVRARSILAKARAAGIKVKKSAFALASGADGVAPLELTLLEKIIYRYPEVIERAGETYEPHHIVTYLVELSAAFNNFYANNTIVSATDVAAPYRVALTDAFVIVMENGLNVLGIRVPERM